MEKKSIGAFIAALRKANGMTQQELADRLNVSNKAVSRWERDENAPDLSLIPAIAEIFGITCDELLKGERIFNEPEQPKSEPKVDKQLKALVNRSISGFRTLIYISLALSAVGYICMLGISYGFYRPIIGFAVAMLFFVGAVVVAFVGTGSLKTSMPENELFENADPILLEKFNKALKVDSFNALYCAFSAFCLSLPLVIFSANISFNVVLSFRNYLQALCFIIPLLFLIHWSVKNRYYCRITDQPYFNGDSKEISYLKTDILQLICLLCGGVLIFCDVYFVQLSELWGRWILPSVAVAFLACDIILSILFIYRHRNGLPSSFLIALRNMALVVPTFTISYFFVGAVWPDGHIEREYYSDNVPITIALYLIIYTIFTSLYLIKKGKRS